MENSVRSSPRARHRDPDHDKGQVRDSIKSINASVAAINERAASIEAALKGSAARDEAFKNSVEANEKRVGGLHEFALSLDYRTSVLEGKSSSVKPSQKPAKGKPEDVYAAGYKAIKAKDYKKAIETFTAFLEDYPEHKLSGNAAYWLGEAHYAKGF